MQKKSEIRELFYSQNNIFANSIFLYTFYIFVKTETSFRLHFYNSIETIDIDIYKSIALSVEKDPHPLTKKIFKKGFRAKKFRRRPDKRKYPHRPQKNYF